MFSPRNLHRLSCANIGVKLFSIKFEVKHFSRTHIFVQGSRFLFLAQTTRCKNKNMIFKLWFKFNFSSPKIAFPRAENCKCNFGNIEMILSFEIAFMKTQRNWFLVFIETSLIKARVMSKSEAKFIELHEFSRKSIRSFNRNFKYLELILDQKMSKINTERDDKQKKGLKIGQFLLK